MTNLAAQTKPQVRVVRRAGDVAVVSLVGEHDLATGWELRNALAFALEQGAHIVVDLSETGASVMGGPGCFTRGRRTY